MGIEDFIRGIFKPVDVKKSDDTEKEAVTPDMTPERAGAATENLRFNKSEEGDFKNAVEERRTAEIREQGGMTTKEEDPEYQAKMRREEADRKFKELQKESQEKGGI